MRGITEAPHRRAGRRAATSGAAVVALVTLVAGSAPGAAARRPEHPAPATSNPSMEEPAGEEPAALVLFASRCATRACHAGPHPEMGMDLGSGRAYSSTVGVPSRSDPRLLRVTPGDPEASLLYRKLFSLEVMSRPGDRMPLHDRPLDEAERETVRRWIASLPPVAARPREPVFQDAYLAQLPTPTRLGKNGFRFRIAHRFRGPALDAGLEELLGIDTGAWVSLGLAYGISERWEVGLRHSTLLQQEELFFKVSLWSQESGDPLSVSAFGSGSSIREAGRANTHSGQLQLLVARRFGPVSLLVAPSYATRTNYLNGDDDRGTLVIGLGGEWRLSHRFAILGEWVGQASGVEDAYQSGSIGFGIRTARHSFQLLATNTRGAQTSLYLPGGDLDWGDGDFRLGFNLTRYFTVHWARGVDDVEVGARAGGDPSGKRPVRRTGAESP